MKQNHLLDAVRTRGVVTAAELSCHDHIASAIALGADLGVLYHTAYLGIPKLGGLLPLCNPNETVEALLERVRPLSKDLPIAVGVCGTEPFRVFEDYLLQLKNADVTYIQNFPTVGLIDGRYRENIEGVNFGFAKECQLIKKSLDQGLTPLPFVFRESEALKMAEAGARVLIAHPGPRFASESILVSEETFRAETERLNALARRIKEVCPDVKVLQHVKLSDHAQTILSMRGSSSCALDGAYYEIKPH